MRLCRDKDCLRYGIALSDDEFGRNAFYERYGRKDCKNIYCKQCCLRRTKEYRSMLRHIAFRSKARLPVEAGKQGIRR